MLVTEDLVKVFKDAKRGEVRAVDGVSFTAKPGEVLGLLGGNGAGKTTTLRMLSTVIAPTSGTATINGLDVIKQSDQVRACIGFLSNSTALYPRLTGREIFSYFGGLYGLDNETIKQRTEEISNRLNLKDFIDRPCDKLSTGQKQRVSIGRTILHDPPVLFFDEPTAGLDVVSSQAVLEFIEESRDHQKTIIFSTHIMSEAERLCDHIVIINEGKIRGEGTVQQIKELGQAATLERAFLNLVNFKSDFKVGSQA